MSDNRDSIHKGDDDDMGVNDHGSKKSIEQEFFFIIAALEFWKFDRLVAKQGDGCLIAALKTIQRQANLHRKGMYNNKTKFSLNFSSLKL
jgi:hypothetical protein